MQISRGALARQYAGARWRPDRTPHPLYIRAGSREGTPRKAVPRRRALERDPTGWPWLTVAPDDSLCDYGRHAVARRLLKKSIEERAGVKGIGQKPFLWLEDRATRTTTMSVRVIFRTMPHRSRRGPNRSGTGRPYSIIFAAISFAIASPRLLSE